MPRFRLRTLFLAIAALGIVICFFPLSVAVWDGHFPVLIDVRSELPVQRVEYWTNFSKELADRLAAKGWDDPDLSWRMAEFKGDRYVAYGRSSGRFDPLFQRELSYVQERVIVVRCTLKDGTEHRKCVDIPPRPGPRSVTISIP